MNDSLAQQVEHLPFKEVVDGSNPSRVTIVNYYVRPHRLAVQDPALSRRLQGFKSPWGRQIIFFFNVPFGRLAQLVERHPSKVDVESSNLFARSIFLAVERHLAGFPEIVSSHGSEVEYFLGKEGVASSILGASSIFK